MAPWVRPLTVDSGHDLRVVGSCFDPMGFLTQPEVHLRFSAPSPPTDALSLSVSNNKINK